MSDIRRSRPAHLLKHPESIRDLIRPHRLAEYRSEDSGILEGLCGTLGSEEPSARQRRDWAAQHLQAWQYRVGGIANQHEPSALMAPLAQFLDLEQSPLGAN